MVFDRTENEPEEWDPEEEFYDPDSDSLTIPQVSTGDDETAGSADESDAEVDDLGQSLAEADVSADLLQTFWALVLVLNAAVLAVSLGLLILFFEGAPERGGLLLAAGLLLFGFAGRRYRRFREADDAADDTAPEAATEDGAETTSGVAPEEEPPNRSERS